MKYYQVRWGFEPSQYVSIDETELSKALRAQMHNSMAIFKSGTSITGSNIKVIEPDFHKYLGYNPNYLFQGDDWSLIPQKVKDEHRLFLENTSETLIAGREGRTLQLKEPNPNVRLYTKEPTTIGDLLPKLEPSESL